jgi:hypothetical protein
MLCSGVLSCSILHAVEVGKALLCDCQQLQQQQQGLPPKQPHTRDGIASSVHILAVAAGSSTDGSSSGSNSSSTGNSSSGSCDLSGSRDGSPSDDVSPAADVHTARAAAAGVQVLLQAKRQASLPLAAQQASKAAAAAAAAGGGAAAATQQVLHSAAPSPAAAADDDLLGGNGDGSSHSMHRHQVGQLGGRQPQHGGAAGGVAGYVCILDDDVLLHPLGLMQLVDELEDDPGLFMATGG